MISHGMPEEFCVSVEKNGKYSSYKLRSLIKTYIVRLQNVSIFYASNYRQTWGAAQLCLL